jgi:hypothetical protein
MGKAAANDFLGRFREVISDPLKDVLKSLAVLHGATPAG